MYRNIIKKNPVFSAVVLFVLLFAIVQIMKPMFLFNDDGSIREFGIGYRNKTIFPIWLFSIVLGIVSYLSIMYYIHHSQALF
jgi:hypothetical protein